MLEYNLADTIVAVSTPPGNSLAGIIRLSGPEALARAREMFVAENPLPAVSDNSAGRVAVRGKITWNDGGVPLAVPAVLYLLPGPKSYTGEDTAEIIVPGAACLLEMLVAEIVRRGARLAAAGEFTWRAFFRNRMDLREVNAVAALIGAADQQSRRAAVDVLRQGVSGKISAWREELQTAAALVESEIDFSEEETPDEFFTALSARLEKLSADCASAVEASRASLGRGEGLAAGLVGLTNAGKSSLFNLLLGRPAAIVSPRNSTTRDQITGTLDAAGTRWLLIDCPGEDFSGSALGDTLHARNAALNRDFALTLVVIDGRTEAEADVAALERFLRDLPAGRVVWVYNKCDGLAGGGNGAAEAAPRIAATVAAARAAHPEWLTVDTVCVSAKTSAGREKLLSALEKAAAQDCGVADAVAADARTRDALERADAAVVRAQTWLAEMNLEFAAFELREAYQIMTSLSGETYGEDILQNIFSRFCIGK